jgi:hypothetical protein
VISLGEAKPGIVRKLDGWTAATIRWRLEAMGELSDDNLNVWLEADIRPRKFFCCSTSIGSQTAEDQLDDSYPCVYK